MAGGSVLAGLGGTADFVRCTIVVDEELSIPSAELPDHRQRRLRIVVDIGGLVLGGDHAFGARGNLPPPPIVWRPTVTMNADGKCHQLTCVN